MSRPIIAGLDTEYGLLIEARGAQDQVEDATSFVQAYSGPGFKGWDYRAESPRADLRGFRLDRLAQDPVDAQFDAGRTYAPADKIRSDRILPIGARFYNDHGHPEYATAECVTLAGIATHDVAGDETLRRAAQDYAARIGRQVRVYKNNTDFHGASYGTHESYLVDRSHGFDRLFAAITPMLVARQVLTGAGKVGAEMGFSANYQISQRADFFMEPANAETLYRRPIFNTRDEPHAEHAHFVRLHVISGDSNMIAAATARKIGLVKIALRLLEIGENPEWPIADPVRAFQGLSRDESYEFKVPLKNGRWTTAYEILESYFAAAERFGVLTDEEMGVVTESRRLLTAIQDDFPSFAYDVDWAAKRMLLENYMESEGTDWRDPSLSAFDLEYHNLDRDESLHEGMVEAGMVRPNPPSAARAEPTRARARSIAVSRFAENLQTANWRSLTFRVNGNVHEVALPPNALYPDSIDEIHDVEAFISALRQVATEN